MYGVEKVEGTGFQLIGLARDLYCSVKRVGMAGRAPDIHRSCSNHCKNVYTKMYYKISMPWTVKNFII